MENIYFHPEPFNYKTVDNQVNLSPDDEGGSSGDPSGEPTSAPGSDDPPLPAPPEPAQ